MPEADTICSVEVPYTVTDATPMLVAAVVVSTSTMNLIDSESPGMILLPAPRFVNGMLPNPLS
jgi:hypothetical protein